jgi:glycosyltransferase involved in cell wall biosynthesis
MALTSNGGRHVRGILVLDMSYTLAMFRERQMDRALESRDAGGLFDHVISVHPLAGLFESGDERYGAPRVTPIGMGQQFVEGKIGRFKWPLILAPLNFLLAQVGLIRLLRRMAEDVHVTVVRVGDPHYLGLMGWLLARLLEVPLAIRVPFRYDEIRRLTGRATMPRLLRFGWVEERIERFVFPRCDLIAGANEDNMRYAIEKGGRPDVATVFRYGNLLHHDHQVDPRCRPAADADLAELGLTGHRFLATVARLEPMKRVDDVVRVVAELSSRGVSLRALIVGDGTLRQQLVDMARSLGVEHLVVFAGSRNQEWIARVLPRAAVIVSPHMGRALVEAALSGVPIVAFDYDWQREVVVDGETGFLVPNGDGLALAARTEELLGDPARSQRMGEQARAWVATMMDPESLMRHEQATYERLMEQWAGER